MNYLKPKNAKLPLPPDEAALIRHRRALLDNLIEKINELALITHQEGVAEAKDRAAAREAAAAQQASPPPPKPAKMRPKPAETPAPEPRAPAPRAPRATKPEVAVLYLVRAIDTCMRLDAFLADRLAHAHTTAELAGLNHPNRQPILDYMHKMIRFEQPYQFQRTTHDAMETRITEELAWAPNRNPADIIVELCTQINLPFDPEDFPNNWRPTPPQDPPPKPREDPDWNDPEVQQEIYQNIQDEMENRRLRGLDE